MGKCSGLKGGGHHRKAIDVADKKRSEKQARKKEQEAAGKRAIVLREILGGKLGSLDCDIYLRAADAGEAGAGCTAELCRAHFRYENCSNRRCKFSHEHSIAEALQNVVSGSNNAGDDADDIPTVPALRFLPGITWSTRQKKRQSSRWRRKQPTLGGKQDVEDGMTSLSLDSPSPMENALSGGSSVANTIVAHLQSNQDVLNLALSCRNLHHTVLLDGEGCQDVQRRKKQFKEAQQEDRNHALLKSKATGGNLRYVVSYMNCSNNNPKGGKSSKKKKHRKDTAATTDRQRPVLIYDYENPHVFLAFREAALAST